MATTSTIPSAQMEIESLPEQPSKITNLEIANLVKISQTQNGLKHSDYKRYRSYCSRKVKRIRKTMKATLGGKFQKKKIHELFPNDPQTLQVLLFSAERQWAFGMDLKQQIAGGKEEGRKKENRRIKFSVRRKFRKAIAWAKTLAEICHSKAESKTALESEAYSQYLQGLYFFEVESWESALNSFVKSRQIYSDLAKLSDSLQKIVFLEKIEQIDQSIRYCNFKLSKGSKLLSLEEILELKTKAHDPSLTERLEALLEESRRKEMEGSGTKEVDFCNEKLPLKNEKVLLCLHKVEEIDVNLRGIGGEEKNFEEKLACYIEIFSLYDEAIKFNSKEKEESTDSELKLKILAKIHAYLHYSKLLRYLERNFLQLNQARLRLKKQQKGQKITSPFEIVRWCDNLLQIYKQIIELLVNTSLSKPFEIEENYFSFVRCYYLSLIYSSAKKHLEAYSLLIYVENNLKDLKKLLQKKNLIEDLHNILEEIKLVQSKNVAGWYEGKSKEEGEVIGMMEEVDLDGKKKKKATLENLITSLESNTELTQKLGTEIIELPPKMELMSCKPISFDIAFGFLKYPNIDKKIKEEKKGFLSAAISRFNIFKKN